MFERGGDGLLSIRDLAGNEEPFSDFKGLKRTRKVNGEKTISLAVLPTKANHHSFNMIEEETTITFDGDEYVIKKLQERSIGKTYIKQAEAVHKLYVDLINKQQPQIHNGSITFNNYMQMVFEDTGYTFVAIDNFPARSFQNLGNDNRLALLQKGLERFQAEFELVGTQVRFKKQIGNDTDFQFRFGHNIKTISKDIDTTNLATVIHGKGAEGIEAYYRSPNADIFGEIEAPPVEDERFTSEEGLLEEMKARLQDTPEVSITIDFADLRAAGYPYTVPNEGDRVWVIYEPMNDLLIETRIMEIEEEFDVNLNPIKTNVTLANYKKTFAGTRFDSVQKQLRNIVNDDGVIRYSVLDEAVRIATEALQSAQTELIFENGIIARDKNDPNRLVLFNSEGIGISSDGGQTFREAITSDGFVLTAGAIGRLAANNIQIGPETEFDTGYDPSTKETPIGAQQKADQAELNAKGYADDLDATIRDNLNITAPLPNSIALNSDGITAYAGGTDRFARLDYRGLYIHGGAIQIDGGLPDDQIESANKWNTQGTYINSQGIYTGQVSANQIVTGILDTENVLVRASQGTQSVQIDDTGLTTIDGNGNVRIHLGVRNIAGKGQSDPSTLRFFSGAGSTSASIGMNVNDHFIIGSDSTDVAMELRSGKNTINYAQQHRFVMEGEPRFLIFGNVPSQSTGNLNPSIYPDSPNWGFVGTPNAPFHRVYASEVNETSSLNLKTNVRGCSVALSYNVLENLNIKSYNIIRKSEDGEVVEPFKKYGVVAEESPKEILDESGQAVNLYSFISHVANVTKDLIKRMDQLEGGHANE
mgnify:FL=1